MGTPVELKSEPSTSSESSDDPDITHINEYVNYLRRLTDQGTLSNSSQINLDEINDLLAHPTVNRINQLINRLRENNLLPQREERINMEEASISNINQSDSRTSRKIEIAFIMVWASLISYIFSMLFHVYEKHQTM